MSRHRSPEPPAERKAPPSPELQQVLNDLQSPDDWTRAKAVRELCPCRRKDWGEPVYRYVCAMRDDPSPIVRGAVRHDLTENRRWNESWEEGLIQERRARRIKVSLALKATALADLCKRLRRETGLPLMADAGVADEKVTLFCRQMPVRTVMRQLTGALDYAWDWQKQEDAGHFALIRDPQPPPRRVEVPVRQVRGRMLRARVSLSVSPCGSAGRHRERADSESHPVKVTSAELLEALHHASGFPIIADYHTRLASVEPEELAGRPLLAMIQQVAGTMRLRWQFSEGDWLQFRSIWGYYEQLQEVPSRLLSRWSEWRRREGYLPLEALMEIAALPGVQRTSEAMAAGACEIWGLIEWPLAAGDLSGHLRFLATCSPSQREQAIAAQGLRYVNMSCEQQQRFLSLAQWAEAPLSPEALLRVEYRPATQSSTAAEAQLEFCYQHGTGDAPAGVRLVATPRGCEVHRHPPR
jgi:hypothetical protein